MLRRRFQRWRQALASAGLSLLATPKRDMPPPMVRREYGSLQDDARALRRDAMRNLAGR